MGWFRSLPFNDPEPKEYWDAIYSIQWAIAMALLGYQPGPEWVIQERLNDPKCLSMAKKVKVDEDPIATELWTRNGFSNDIPNTIELVAKGKVFRKRATSQSWLGSPQNPMTREMLEGKFLRLVSRVLGENGAHELLKAFNNLQDLTNVKDLTRLYKSQIMP